MFYIYDLIKSPVYGSRTAISFLISGFSRLLKSISYLNFLTQNNSVLFRVGYYGSHTAN